MSKYDSPGVYVEEISSGSAPIAGVGTSVAAFIGEFYTINVTRETNQIVPTIEQGIKTAEPSIITADEKYIITLAYPVIEVVAADSTPNTEEVTIINENSIQLKFVTELTEATDVTVTYIHKTQITETTYILNEVQGENVGIQNKETRNNIIRGEEYCYPLKNHLVDKDGESGYIVKVKVDGVPNSEAYLNNNYREQKSYVCFNKDPQPNESITVDYSLKPTKRSVQKEEIKLCTNFTEFKNFFGDFFDPKRDIKGQNTLAHAVYGFFRNGGTRCYVTWISGIPEISENEQINKVLDKFKAIDEISILAAPGGIELRGHIKDHCKKMGDRVAILDSEEDTQPDKIIAEVDDFNSEYAALYYPWIKVYDPASESNIFVPPSGHIAGVYARVDGTRGVHKAPANETILGALDLKYNLSKAKQEPLNPQGINCIRKLNGNIRIWGARTLGGDANGEFKYINIRRQFCYLKDSIDKGTQWTVFEPNDSELWAKIRRNIGAFLTNEWRNGALFGTTPEEAFYVKCDAENNPPEVRDLGQVITEIGVALIKPAEFVIFNLSQWTGS